MTTIKEGMDTARYILFPGHTKTNELADGEQPDGANWFDSDRVGQGPNRTIQDAADTAENNARSYIESALSVIAVPLLGLFQIARAPFTNAPVEEAAVGLTRLVLGAPANGLQALADASQMTLAVADVGLKLLQGRPIDRDDQ